MTQIKTKICQFRLIMIYIACTMLLSHEHHFNLVGIFDCFPCSGSLCVIQTDHFSLEKLYTT